jgi:hypothetical protein
MADIMLKEIENGVSITTPNGHEYIYTVYPWRVDKINPADLGKTAVRNKDYNDITFNKECGTLRRTNKNVAMLNIAKLLADVNRFMYNAELDEEHQKKIILAMELAYKNKVATFGLAYGLSDEDRVLLRNLKYVSTKNISQAIAKKERYNDIAYFLQEAISLSLKNKLSSIILEHMQLTKSDSSALLHQSTFDMLIKYQKEIEYMIVTQDKKVQEIENIVNNIMNSIPNYIRGWLYYKPQSVFKLKDEYKKTNKQISLIDIIDTLKYIERTCAEMGIANTDYIKNKSYSEFLISADELKKVYKDYLEKHKFELFEKRQQKLPKYSKIIDEHKIELVIPYTYKDCQKIGNDFHNCFGAYEWNEYLITGQRYGCALYMDGQPYICLDIYTDNNIINQYLYSHNRYVPSNDKIAKIAHKDLQELFNNITK